MTVPTTGHLAWLILVAETILCAVDSVTFFYNSADLNVTIFVYVIYKMTHWSREIGQLLIKSATFQIIHTEYENDYTKPILEHKPLLEDILTLVKTHYLNNKKPICVRQYKKTEKDYKTKLYLFESHYVKKDQHVFVNKNIKEYRNYKFTRRHLNINDTMSKLMSTFVNTDNMTDDEYNLCDKDRAYKLVYLRKEMPNLNAKYIPLYRAYKNNPNISTADCTKYYNDKKTDIDYPVLDNSGQACKIIGYQKDYTKKIREHYQTLDTVHSEWLNVWRELTHCPEPISNNNPILLFT